MIATTLNVWNIDLVRAVTLAGIAWTSGSTLSALFLFVRRYREEPSRLWLARCLLRISTLCLLFFVVDSLLSNWADPVYLRNVVALFGVYSLSWALEIVTHDVLRTPGRATRRRDDEGANLA